MSLAVAVKTEEGIVIGADRMAIIKRKSTGDAVAHRYKNDCKIIVYSPNIVLAHVGSSKITYEGKEMYVTEWIDILRELYPDANVMELPTLILREYTKAKVNVSCAFLVAGLDKYYGRCMLMMDCDHECVSMANSKERGIAVGADKIAFAMLEELADDGLNTIDGMKYASKEDGIELVEGIIQATGLIHSHVSNGCVSTDHDIYYIDGRGKDSGWIVKHTVDVTKDRKKLLLHRKVC